MSNCDTYVNMCIPIFRAVGRIWNQNSQILGLYLTLTHADPYLK